MQKILFTNYGGTPIYVIRINGNGWETPIAMYGTTNTTIDSNGFIKAASPVINLFADYIEPNSCFSQEHEKKPMFEKLSIGCYKISNTPGLVKGEYAGDWNVEVPKDINGERYFNTEWEQLEDNSVIIRTYEREAVTEEYQRYDEDGNALTDTQGNVLKFYKRHEINGKAES